MNGSTRIRIRKPMRSPRLSSLHRRIPSGHDFGHRVLYESLRYAAAEAMGIEDRWAVLDRIRVLPKMHGTRARVETPRAPRFRSRGCADSDGPPRMPLTVRKLNRMLQFLEAQFVSFTE